MSVERIHAGVKKYAERLHRELLVAADRFHKAQDAAKNYLLATNPNGLDNGLHGMKIEEFLTSTEDTLRQYVEEMTAALKDEPWTKERTADDDMSLDQMERDEQEDDDE